MSNSEEQAAHDGIESYANTRAAIIELRNKKLTGADFGEAVLLSHVIWWLSVLKTQTS